VIHDDLPEMQCRELVELVTDYLEDRLPPEGRARFEAHIAECEYCETYLEQMRQTIRVLGRLPEDSLSPKARDVLLSAFRDWSRGCATGRADDRPRAVTEAALAALIIRLT
jgi:anti-sigma factor RsiW